MLLMAQPQPTRPRRKRRSRAAQQSFVFPTHGGKRRRAGRRPLGGARMGPAHRRRPSFAGWAPVHVTMRMRYDVRASLRRGKLYARARTALRAARERLGCRIIHFSILGNHVHLIVEAQGDAALRAGMKGFAVRMARSVNRSRGRSGQVFPFRYDARRLTRPLQTRNVLLYVIQNYKKHAAERADPIARDRRWVDALSSAPYFDGWRTECHAWIPPPEPTSVAPVVPARHWLLTTGWRKHGLLDTGDLPSLRLDGGATARPVG